MTGGSAWDIPCIEIVGEKIPGETLSIEMQIEAAPATRPPIAVVSQGSAITFASPFSTLSSTGPPSCSSPIHQSIGPSPPNIILPLTR